MGKGNVLLFCPEFYNFRDEISNQLREIGYNVDAYDERPANNFIVKALIRINRIFLDSYIKSYYERIIKTTKDNDYRYIIIIKGESVAIESLTKLKRYHKVAKFILYLWDSVKNDANALKIYTFFDKVLSFDRVDCANLKFDFLPLFYTKEYENIPMLPDVSHVNSDLIFIGTIHSDRYIFLSKIKSQAIDHGFKCTLIMVFQSKMLFFKMKFFDHLLPKAKMRDFLFNKIPRTSVIELLSKSRVVVDVQHPLQLGLTIRTIETLGANRKLITTNSDIVNYDFYKSANICVVDRCNPIIPSDFVTSEYEDLPATIYKKYSISSWVNSLIS